MWKHCASLYPFQMHTNICTQIDSILCIQKHLVHASSHHTHTVTLTLTGMQTHKWAHRYTHIYTNTHTELCLPAGFAFLKEGNTSFNQTGQLRTNFSFVVTAWGPKGLQSLYWQSAAHWLFLQKLLNNLVWILIRTLTVIPHCPAP